MSTSELFCSKGKSPSKTYKREWEGMTWVHAYRSGELPLSGGKRDLKIAQLKRAWTGGNIGAREH